MKSLITTILVAASLAFASASNPDLDEQWEDFLQRYDKNYDPEGEEVCNCIFHKSHNLILHMIRAIGVRSGSKIWPSLTNTTKKPLVANILSLWELMNMQIGPLMNLSGT